MKKNLHYCITLNLLVFVGCKKEKDMQVPSQLIEKKLVSKSKNNDSIKLNESKTIPDSIVNHFFEANGGSILYLRDGSMRSCARCDSDGDFIAELLNTEPHYSYKDFNTYVLANNSRTDFFNEWGKIDRSWKIINGINISYDHELVSYKKAAKNIKTLEKVIDTRLIIFEPEYKTFKDENSEEAEAYFISMDDWNWYSHGLYESFQKLKIETQYLKSRYVTLPIENNEVLNIDTWSNINGAKVQALLYKKNHRPLIIHLISSDNDFNEINEYLKK